MKNPNSYYVSRFEDFRDAREILTASSHDDAAKIGAQIGQRRMDAAIDLLLKCQETNEWPGYGHYLEPVWPAWALSE